MIAIPNTIRRYRCADLFRFGAWSIILLGVLNLCLLFSGLFLTETSGYLSISANLGHQWAIFSALSFGFMGAALFYVFPSKPELRLLRSSISLCFVGMTPAILLTLWVLDAGCEKDRCYTHEQRIKISGNYEVVNTYVLGERGNESHSITLQRPIVPCVCWVWPVKKFDQNTYYKSRPRGVRIEKATREKIDLSFVGDAPPIPGEKCRTWNETISLAKIACW